MSAKVVHVLVTFLPLRPPRQRPPLAGVGGVGVGGVNICYFCKVWSYSICDSTEKQKSTPCRQVHVQVQAAAVQPPRSGPGASRV